MKQAYIFESAEDMTGFSYDEWIQSFDGKVKKLVLSSERQKRRSMRRQKAGIYRYRFLLDTFEDARGQYLV